MPIDLGGNEDKLKAEIEKSITKNEDVKRIAQNKCAMRESAMQSKEHWNSIYTSKSSDRVSWFQTHAKLSLQLINETGVLADASIIDVGGGASTLVDDLLDSGFSQITVLDLSDRKSTRLNSSH